MIKKLITENSIGLHLIQFHCNLWSKSQQQDEYKYIKCLKALEMLNNQTCVQRD